MDIEKLNHKDCLLLLHSEMCKIVNVLESVEDASDEPNLLLERARIDVDWCKEQIENTLGL